MATNSTPLPPHDQAFFDGVPKGVILPWFVGTGVIPIGWLVCDGNNGTPNLANQFLIGVSNPTDVGKPFGNASHSHSLSGTTGNAFNHSDAFKINDDRGCCPQVTGLAHMHDFNAHTDTQPNIPPSVGVIFIIKA